MANDNLAKIDNNYTKRKHKLSHENTKDIKIYTPEIIPKYKDAFKRVFKITNDKTKTNFIMYNKIFKWYENEKNVNISMERIYIKSKLGSYNSGGCGLSGSLFAGLTSSGIIFCLDNYVKRIGPLIFAIYFLTILCFGMKILSHEDNKVEMYNMFLEVLNDIEYDNNDN
ncbi:hypothetical protein [Clostridium sp.]|uniref:hypothetical protein n=1 Tax=Clostridium sp. TaxID=1506 RepID=UPI00283C3C61|nr:hypothetical protein [Clostridium sp.]MDR3597492.1 hypothetical protein [Clostridium sp.]